MDTMISVNSLSPKWMLRILQGMMRLTPLYATADKGDYEIFKLIFESLGNTNKNPRTHSGYTPLYIAARNGHLKICKIILEGVDDKNPVTNDGLTPLDLAATNKHLEVFKFILEKMSVKIPKTNNEVATQRGQHSCTNTAEKRIFGLIWERFENLWK